MYNRIDIDQRPLSSLNEVVLTSQGDHFFGSLAGVVGLAPWTVESAG